jgi:hypothetical protein
MADIHEAAFSASYVAAHELLAGTIPAFAVLLADRARDFADLGEVVHTHCPHLFVNDRPEEGLKLWRAPAAEEDALLPETPKQKALVAPLIDGWRERLELELSANRTARPSRGGGQDATSTPPSSSCKRGCRTGSCRSQRTAASWPVGSCCPCS